MFDDIFTHIDSLLDEIRKRRQEPQAIRVGADVRADFEARAGAAYVDGAYFGIPVTFDAIDPTSVSIDSEPTQ